MCSCCGVGLCGCGASQPGVSRVIYFLWFLLSAVLSWILREYGRGILQYLPAIQSCMDMPDEEDCLGKQAVLRISFANVVFYAVHMVLLFGVRSSEDLRLSVHTGLWPLKFLAWVALSVLGFWLPYGSVGAYGQVARVFSGFYLVLQLIVLLDFVYRLNSALLDKGGCVPVLVALTALCFLAGLTGIGIQYFLFAASSSCGLNIFIITFTLILGCVACLVSVLPNRAKDAGLFTASCVFLYASFLAFSALNSEPNSSGQCLRSMGTGSGWIAVCGFILALGSAAWSALSAGSQRDAFTFDISAELAGGEEDGKADEELTFSPWLFHLMFALASCYLAMVLTGWDWTQASNNELELDRGYISLWVKVAAQWVCYLLYTWTVVAPVLLPDRDFG